MNELTPDLLTAVLDTLIPPDAKHGMPGAGTIGLASAVLPSLDETQRAALGMLEGFAALAAPERTLRLQRLDGEHPGLLPAVHVHTIQHYYQHPAVVAALGVESHPPYPAGFALEPGNLDGLERVRARGPLFREP